MNGNIVAAPSGTNDETMVFINPDELAEPHILGILPRAVVSCHRAVSLIRSLPIPRINVSFMRWQVVYQGG